MDHPKAASPERSTTSKANRHLYKVVPVRLPEDKWEVIRQEAAEMGIGPSTLARIWILESLRHVNGANHNGDGHRAET